LARLSIANLSAGVFFVWLPFAKFIFV